jgi:hypothetical protein
VSDDYYDHPVYRGVYLSFASELLPFHPRTRELQVKQQERDVAFFEKLGIDPTKGTSPSIDR